jgi:stress response protein YsnF
MAQTVIGFFDDASEAQQAITKLSESGISRDRIDVSRGSGMSGGVSSPGSSSASSDRSASGSTSDGRTSDREGRNTNKITDFFNSLFGGGDKDNENDSTRYRTVAEQSEAIVTVHAQSREEAERAADILDDCGAVDVDERASQYGYENTRSTEGNIGRQDVSGERGASISRVEENLEVGKRTVETGGVRLRSRIIEKPVEEHVRLREENVHVEREQVNRPATEADMRSLRDQEIELTERAEVPVVNKEARVVEEVRLTKDVEERDETIRDTVRNTDIDVEKLGSGNADRADGIGRANTDMDDSTRSEGMRDR